jgi:predicted Zn finger-like uncharacterized protein
MIIQCENCHTKYNLDQNLLEHEGSKVRCSLCKHTFTAFPPDEDYAEAPEPTTVLDEDFVETVALDSPPREGEGEPEVTFEEEEVDFNRAFEESLDKHETGELFSQKSSRQEPEEESSEQLIEEPFVGEPLSEMETDLTREESSADGAKTVKIEPPPKRAKRPRILLFVLLLILLLICGAAALVLWAPQYLPDSLSMLKPMEKSSVADLGVRRLSFNGVTGSFVDAKKAGNLFVIRGMVKNDYSKSRSFILVKGTILDDKGQVIRQQVAYAGNTFTDEELQELSMDEVDKAMKNRFGMAKKNFDLAPGASNPFMIVFENLPDNLSEFTVEAVSSSPGT